MGLETDAYQQGFSAGYADGCLVIDNPPGVNGHTIERFIEIRDRYDAAILSSWPSAYQCGYADGVDQRAEESAGARDAVSSWAPDRWFTFSTSAGPMNTPGIISAPPPTSSADWPSMPPARAHDCWKS